MKSSSLCCLLLMLAPLASAQQTSPHLGYIYPAGGKQGASFQVTFGGQFLEGASNVIVSGSGVQASIIDFTKPMSQGEFNRLRDTLRELQDKRQASMRQNRKRVAEEPAPGNTNSWSATDEKTFTDLRDRILKNPPNRDGTPAIAENVVVRFALEADAGQGEREIRLATPAGLSNPLKFCIGNMPEISQPPAKAPNPDLERFLERLGKPSRKTQAKTELSISLPAVVNGQITPGSADRFRFHARKGLNLVAVVQARDLIPYLADAVPGWFQATLTLYDAKGKEIAYNDDYRFNPDPVLHFEIPREADYVLEIKDALYRGREDFVYRVTLGELPFVTSLFPAGGRAGDKLTIHLQGWNLPTNNLALDLTEQSQPGLILLRLFDAKLPNHLPFAVDSVPEVTPEFSGKPPDQMQKLELPVIVNGRIGRPGEEDVFRFAGHGGEAVVMEVNARRLGSPLDSAIAIADATGSQIAFNDDCEDKASGLLTHYADSYLRVTLPADGTYAVHLRDAQLKGSPDHFYRLRISPPQPDFDVRLVPSSINIRPGITIPLTLVVFRKDGFSNEIRVVLKDPPPGFALSGATIPAGQERVRISLTAPLAPTSPLKLALEGKALINGKAVSRPVVPAEEMMQAFANRHLVPSKETQVAVLGRGLPRPFRLVTSSPVKLALGGTAPIQIAGPGNTDRFQFELDDAPEGIAIRKVSPTAGGIEIVLQSDCSKTNAGLKGNLIINVHAINTAQANAPGKRPSNQRRLVGCLPAIPFEIVPATQAEAMLRRQQIMP